MAGCQNVHRFVAFYFILAHFLSADVICLTAKTKSKHHAGNPDKEKFFLIILHRYKVCDGRRQNKTKYSFENSCDDTK